MKNIADKAGYIERTATRMIIIDEDTFHSETSTFYSSLYMYYVGTDSLRSRCFT
jgi:hypothetical protein